MEIAPAPMQTPRPRALLWDLDNVAGPAKHLLSLAAVLTGLVDADALRVAAAHRRRFRECGPFLAETGVELISGGRRRNGADFALLNRARSLHQQGVDRFLVASNDGRFSKVADLGELHVVTHTPGSLSTRLIAAASTVLILGCDGHGWQTHNMSDASGGR